VDPQQNKVYSLIIITTIDRQHRTVVKPAIISAKNKTVYRPKLKDSTIGNTPSGDQAQNL